MAFDTNTTDSIQIPSDKELEFALFCIDFVAKKLEQSPELIYQKLKTSGLLQSYIIDNYEVLHTQSKDYIIDDIINVMNERGLL